MCTLHSYICVSYSMSTTTNLVSITIKWIPLYPFYLHSFIQPEYNLWNRLFFLLLRRGSQGLGMTTDSPNTPQQHFSDSVPHPRTGPPIQEAHDSLALKARWIALAGGRWIWNLWCCGTPRAEASSGLRFSLLKNQNVAVHDLSISWIRLVCKIRC